jgi:WD40 repeat protein
MASFSPDGNLIAFPISNAVHILTLKTGVIHSFAGDDELITEVVFSPDCKSIARVTLGTVLIWNIGMRRRLRIPRGEQPPLCVIKFSPDAMLVAHSCGPESIYRIHARARLPGRSQAIREWCQL